MRDDSGPAATLVARWFGLRAEDRSAAAMVLHALRIRAARIVAARCRCGIVVAEDHVADAIFIMVYGIRRTPRLRIPATTTLAYLCGVARNDWRWGWWRRARAQATIAGGGPRKCSALVTKPLARRHITLSALDERPRNDGQRSVTGRRRSTLSARA